MGQGGKTAAIWVALLVMVAATAFVACSRSASGVETGAPGRAEETAGEREPVRGGTMYLSMTGAPDGVFNPILEDDEGGYDFLINDLVFDPLFDLNERLEPVPNLAERWEFSADGRAITFFLRQDVRWHDDTAFTSHDVAFTFWSMMHPEYQGYLWGGLDKIQGALAFHEGKADSVRGIEVLDEYTIRFTLQEPYAPLFMNLRRGIIPAHLLAEVPPARLPQHDFNRRPVGTGPFRFVRYVEDRYVELEAYEGYHRGRPYVDRVVYRVMVPEGSLDLLARGELDMVEVTAGTVSQVEALGVAGIYRYPDLGYQYLGLNLKRPFFQDRRVRQALAHAIDRERLVQQVLAGEGEVVNGPIPPASWAYAADLKGYPYDPTQARALLQEAGWEDRDGNGVLERDGREFRITLVYPAGNPAREATAPLIRDDLAAVGISVEPRKLSFDDFMGRVFDRRDFDGYLLGWGLAADPDPSPVWLSAQAAPGGWNPSGFEDDESDRLLKAAVATFDRDVRKTLYDEWQRLIHEEAPYVFLYSPYRIVAMNTRVKGFRPGPHGISRNSHQWWVEEGNR